MPKPGLLNRWARLAEGVPGFPRPWAAFRFTLSDRDESAQRIENIGRLGIRREMPSDDVREGTGNWPTRSLCHIVCIAALLTPPLLYLWAELKFTVNMPIWDDYNAVLTWLYQFSHSSGFISHLSQLFQQHNEHRIFFDRIIALADLFSFGVVNFIYLNVFGYLGLVLTSAAVFVIGKRSGARSYEMIPVALLLFCFSQYENISIAMESIATYWYLFFLVSAIILISRNDGWLNLALGFCLSVLASFTSGGGLIVFPTVLLHYILAKDVRRSLVWAGLSAVVFYIYFVALPYTTTTLDIASHQFARRHLLSVVEYTLLFLGNIMPWQSAAIAAGLAGTAAGVYLVAAKRDGRDRAPSVIAILFFGTASTASINRLADGGVEQALSSRYAIYSALFFSAVYIGCLASARTKILKATVFSLALACSLALYVAWFGTGVVEMRARRSVQESSLLYPDQNDAVAALERSIKSKIFFPLASVYRNLPENLPLDRASLYRSGYFGSIDSIAPQRRADAPPTWKAITVTGWLAIKNDEKPADTVIVDFNGHYYPSIYGSPRPDVAEAYGQPNYLYTGYQSTILLPPTYGKRCRLSVIGVSSPGFYKRPSFYKSPSESFPCRRAVQPGIRQLLLTEPTSPPAFVSAPEAGRAADCSLDLIDGRLVGSLKGPIVVSGEVSLVGWTAPSARHGIGPDATWISLTAADGERRFYRAKTMKRPDVLAAFKQPAMKDPGFSANLDLSGLSGNQELTIYSVHDNKAFRCRQRARLAVR